MADPTTVLAQDPSNTYGAIDTANNEILVAAGTPFTRYSTGTYFLSVPDTTPPGDPVTVWVQTVYRGAVDYFELVIQGTSLPPGQYTYGLTDIRTIVRETAFNAKSSSEYPDSQIDRAIIRAAREWQRLTKMPRVYSAITLATGTSILPGLPSGFLPEYFLEATLTTSSGQLIDPEIQMVTYNDVLRSQLWNSDGLPLANPATGRPTLFGFINQSTGAVNTFPDQNYILNLWFWIPFTSWTPGTSAGPSQFNLPDDSMQEIASGAAGYLQLSEPEKAPLAGTLVTRMQTVAKEFAARDAGGRAPQQIDRNVSYYGSARYRGPRQFLGY